MSVGGTTSLTGAALASEADAAQNILTTGALLTGNLQNAASWSAASSGFGFSLSSRGIPIPSMSPSQKGSGSHARTAYAAIANAQLSIANPALQQALTGQTPAEVIAAPNRDAANTNRALMPSLTASEQRADDTFKAELSLSYLAGFAKTERTADPAANAANVDDDMDNQGEAA